MHTIWLITLTIIMAASNATKDQVVERSTYFFPIGGYSQPFAFVPGSFDWSENTFSPWRNIIIDAEDLPELFEEMHMGISPKVLQPSGGGTGVPIDPPMLFHKKAGQHEGRSYYSLGLHIPDLKVFLAFRGFAFSEETIESGIARHIRQLDPSQVRRIVEIQLPPQYVQPVAELLALKELAPVPVRIEVGPTVTILRSEYIDREQIESSRPNQEPKND